MKVFVFGCLLLGLTMANNKVTVAGGVSSVDVNDSKIVRLGEVAIGHLRKLNQVKGTRQPKLDLVEILEAKSQVVSGSLTTLVLKVDHEDILKKCVVKIWEQPWLGKMEVTEATCENFDESSSKVSIRLFKQFVRKHNKVYKDSQEFNKRFRIFRANLKKIKHLRETEQGTGQYGVTKFADLTSSEFKKYLGYIQSHSASEVPFAKIPEVELPENFDWRQHNAVTPVKDQKFCGSCWAFSAIGNVEGQWAIKKGELLSLSEQELVDCDKVDGGCGGGEMTTAFQQIKKMGGLETENDYPYDGKNEKCHLNKSEIKVKIFGAVNLTTSESDIAKWLYKNGPVSAALNANAMQFYIGGVSHPLKFLCNPNDLDHGILIVGYGVHHSSILNRTLPYWLIKNSWGKHWGEKGYYRLYRGDGSCGINEAVSSSIVK